MKWNYIYRTPRQRAGNYTGITNVENAGKAECRKENRMKITIIST